MSGVLSRVCDEAGWPYHMDSDFYARASVLVNPNQYPPFARRVAKHGGTYAFTEELLERYVRRYRLTFVYYEDWEKHFRGLHIGRRPWRNLSTQRYRDVHRWVTIPKDSTWTIGAVDRPAIVNGKFVYIDRSQAETIDLLRRTVSKYKELARVAETLRPRPSAK